MRDHTLPPGHIWWLSFVDERLPDPFLGTVLVNAASLKGALSLTGIVGCNPGGAVQAYPVDPSRNPELFERTPHLQLLSRDELLALGHHWSSSSGTRQNGLWLGPSKEALN
jgi:hypothetical protein